jgi:hypothetical protein
MPRGAFTAGRHISFDDTWLTAGVGSIDFMTLRNGQDFRPQAIYVNNSSNATEETAGYATIRGILHSENDTFVDTYRVDVRRPVGLAFRKIWATGTTARGIKLLSEI